MDNRPQALVRTALHTLEVRGARAALAFAVNERDTEAAAMARARDLRIPAPHGELSARLYRPANADATAPLMLFFHGGAFMHGDLDSHDALCRRLAAGSGLRILSVEYRLAPEHAFPAQIEDGLTALRWLLTRGAARRRRRLLVGGDSAGGYVVLSAVGALEPGALEMIAGQLLIYPLLQVDEAPWSTRDIERLLGRLPIRRIRARLQAEAGIPSLLDAAALRAMPTVIAVGGALDPCRPDAKAYGWMLKGLGAKVEVLEFPRLVHGFGNMTHFWPEARTAVAEIGRLSRAVLATPPAEP